MYQTILFDLDGTLTDSGQGILNSVAYALEKMGIEEPDTANLNRFIGPPLYESFSRFYQLNPEDTQSAVDTFRVYFKEKGMFENQLYPGIIPLLEELRTAGKTLVIATSKPEIFAKQILEHFGIAHYFDIIAGASLDSSRISKADVIGYAINQLEAFPKHAVMIGDREHDIEGARMHQLPAIGVLYGYGNKQEFEKAGATMIVETVQDLKRVLLTTE
ncbi:TPA: HAD family hydrolase [Streptococcus suis]|uniref:5'-nucleotidase n=3 Tax=Streptococcus suis TaxID=1307 RepID=A0A126UP73_STRSU|nr:HAD family hydrolase [Streptococcus suis]AEB81791.1 HAD-superfamily hydrolase, subfamily IA, variant 1 [Streptococcus suis ST3]AER17699.1 HAD-superfamily hydrolase, subfamily IA, variant 1 [Streptococcus suis D9]AGW87718.1 Phosphoglycolate phosphatase [Streptococcus suis YB51]AHF60046.1 Phosphoglycolate phosphatase [Streptococcus suis 05HAS68]ALA29127.1 5'-nucleotidase [Streptococcus suis]